MKKTKKPNRMFMKKFLIFLAFEFIFTSVSMPLVVFYGPFHNVKKTVVGTFWATLRHQWVAKIFLSDAAIEKIIGDSFAVDPTATGEKIIPIDFTVKHTEKIDVFNVEGDGLDGKLMVIYDPTNIKVGYSSQIPKAGETTSVIAKRNKALAAINAGGFKDNGWTGTGGDVDGFILHNGEIIFDSYQNSNMKRDTVAFTDKGMLIVGQHSINELKQYGVKEAVQFGPALIVNGRTTIPRGSGGGWGISPRTAIGQRENGEVLLLVMDGRSTKSAGATLEDVQDILYTYGAVNAANLDGGSSATMFKDGKVINKPSDPMGERPVPSIFMVMPMNGGTK